MQLGPTYGSACRWWRCWCTCHLCSQRLSSCGYHSCAELLDELENEAPSSITIRRRCQHHARSMHREGAKARRKPRRRQKRILFFAASFALSRLRGEFVFRTNPRQTRKGTG